MKKPGTFGLSQDTIERLLNVASPVILLLIWEICARFGVIDVRFFPAPSKIFTQLMVMVENGQLWKHFWASMQRLFWGFLFGGVPALILGVAMGLSRPLRMLVEPSGLGHLSSAEKRHFAAGFVDFRAG